MNLSDSTWTLAHAPLSVGLLLGREQPLVLPVDGASGSDDFQLPPFHEQVMRRILLEARADAGLTGGSFAGTRWAPELD